MLKPAAAPDRARAPRGATRTRLYGLGTALPEHGAAQEQSFLFTKRVLEASHPGPGAARALAMLERLYLGGGIERRHSVLPDFLRSDPAGFAFFPRNWALEPFPSTAARMQVYEERAIPLAEAAARRALESARVSPAEVTDLLFATCTGFFAPGPDLRLRERLGLRPDVRRTVIGFMGCYAGFVGLRQADDIVRARPDAVALVVCAELCSLHYQKRLDPDSLVAGALFADGASAALLASAGSRPGGLASVAATASAVAPGSDGQMSWRIGEHGFEMRLDRRVPETLGERAPAFVDALLGAAGLDRGEVGGWAIHPGGRRIVSAVGSALGLGPGQADSAYGVLRQCGNMSGATLFFVLERELRRPARPVAALGFGPGLTMEGAVLL